MASIMTSMMFTFLSIQKWNGPGLFQNLTIKWYHPHSRLLLFHFGTPDLDLYQPLTHLWIKESNIHLQNVLEFKLKWKQHTKTQCKTRCLPLEYENDVLKGIARQLTAHCLTRWQADASERWCIYRLICMQDIWWSRTVIGCVHLVLQSRTQDGICMYMHYVCKDNTYWISEIFVVVKSFWGEYWDGAYVKSLSLKAPVCSQVVM